MMKTATTEIEFRDGTYLFKLEIGDWSQDGHCGYVVYLFKCTKTPEHVRSVYERANTNGEVSVPSPREYCLSSNKIDWSLVDAIVTAFPALSKWTADEPRHMEFYAHPEFFRDFFIAYVQRIDPELHFSLIDRTQCALHTFGGSIDSIGYGAADPC